MYIGLSSGFGDPGAGARRLPDHELPEHGLLISKQPLGLECEEGHAPRSSGDLRLQMNCSTMRGRVVYAYGQHFEHYQ